jgi:hypothetical protein
LSSAKFVQKFVQIRHKIIESFYRLEIEICDILLKWPAKNFRKKSGRNTPILYWGVAPPGVNRHEHAGRPHRAYSPRSYGTFSGGWWAWSWGRRRPRPGPRSGNEVTEKKPRTQKPGSLSPGGVSLLDKEMAPPLFRPLKSQVLDNPIAPAVPSFTG